MAEEKSLFSKLIDQFGEKLAWHRLPKPLGLLALIKIRDELREHNLHDTEQPPLERNSDPSAVPEEKVRFRTFDGTYNDLEYPKMGAIGARFGRNFPLGRVHPDSNNLMNPSPRTVSRRLLTREAFQPVEILNLLAAAWIQF
jgi:Animal haem peroxidase